MFLAGAGVAAFAGSLSWMLRTQAGTYTSGDWTDLLWLVAFLLTALSALHPSMLALTRPALRAQDAVGTGRLAVLGLALVVTPAALLAAAGSVEVHLAVPVAGSAALAFLVVMRLGRLVRERERARREVAVRESHQRAVSALAAEALTTTDAADLYRMAGHLTAAVLDDADVSVRTCEQSAPVGWTAACSVSVTAGDGQAAVVEVSTKGGGRITTEEREFLVAIAHVLSSAVQRRQAEAALRDLGLRDPLTGLPNRVLLLDRLGQALRQRSDGGVALLFLDLDGFKAVNDTYGHVVGDRLLAAVARRMRQAVRASDTVGRLAGDEFVVVAHPADDTAVRLLSDRLLAVVDTSIEVGETRVRISASVGAVLAGSGEVDAECLLRRADAAMYEAKREGGARAVMRGANGGVVPLGIG